MKRAELEALMQWYDGVFVDTGLMFHGYRAYMRDYELIVGTPGVTQYRGVYSYVFRNCVEANTRTKLTPDLWRQSLDDRLTNHQTYTDLWNQGIELEGFVWGVGQDLWPGWRLVKDSERAARWTQEFDMEFHEILIETNASEIRLVFSDLFVRHISPELPDMVIPGTDGFHWWLERYWSAPAPSPPFFLTSTETSLPSDDAPVESIRNEDGVLLRRRRLSTMSLHILLDGEPIGMLEPVEANRRKGVIVGWFTPLPAFEQVRDLFRKITLADRLSIDHLRDLTLDYYHQNRDALNLTVITAGGKPVPARDLKIHGVAETGARLDGYKAEFGVTMTGFFNNPRFWSGWS